MTSHNEGQNSLINSKVGPIMKNFLFDRELTLVKCVARLWTLLAALIFGGAQHGWSQLEFPPPDCDTNSQICQLYYDGNVYLTICVCSDPSDVDPVEPDDEEEEAETEEEETECEGSESLDETGSARGDVGFSPRFFVRLRDLSLNHGTSRTLSSPPAPPSSTSLSSTGARSSSSSGRLGPDRWPSSSGNTARRRQANNQPEHSVGNTVGKAVAFKFRHKQRVGVSGLVDTKQPAIFSMGTNSFSPWRSYLYRSPANTNIYFGLLGDGSARQYAINRVDFHSRTRLIETNGEVWMIFPSGAKNVYGQWVTLGTNLYCFLSRKEDKQGSATQFSYAFGTSGSTTNYIKLNKVIDFDGRETTLIYTNNGYYSNVLVGIQGPYGQSSSMTVDAKGQITNMVDVVGVASQIEYDSNQRITKIITPYGTNTYTYYSGSGWEAIRTIEKGTRKSLALRGYRAVNVFPTAISEASALNSYFQSSGISRSFETGGFDERNTFHWGPRQYDNLPSSIRTSLDNLTFDPANLTTNDLKLGTTIHWLRAKNGGTGTNEMASYSISLKRSPSPSSDGSVEGLLTWYDYEGKTGSNNEYEGSKSKYRAKAWRKPGGDWQARYVERNILGKPTVVKETYSDLYVSFSLDWLPEWRTYNYTYADNKIDLLQKTLTVWGSTRTLFTQVFNENHQVTTNYNALGEATVYEYDANHQVTKATYPTGLISDFSYGTNGFLSKVVDRSPTQNFRTNSYTWTNGLVWTQTDPRGLTVTNSWDAFGRLTRRDFPDGTSIQNTYSNLDLVRIIDRMAFTNGFAYNRFRQLAYQTNANGRVTAYQYCSCGALDSITDPLGNSTSFTYDNAGRRTRTTYPDSSWVENTYNVLNQPTLVTDSSGFVVTNTYVLNNLLTYRTSPVGTILRVCYDGEDRATNIFGVDGRQIARSYDSLSRIVHVTEINYDGFGYLTHELDYSPSGLTSITDPLGNVTSYGYDELRRRTAVTNANDEVTLFSYNPGGDLASLTDAKNHSTSWHYDSFGRVTNKIDASATSILKYGYDANSRLTNRWSAAKGNTRYVYDAMGNLTAVDYPASPDIALSYDANNRLTNMVDGIGTTSYSYTSFGALAGEDGPWDNDAITYGYTHRQRTSMSLSQPNAAPWTQTYAYDVMRRLTNTTTAAGQFGYSYRDVTTWAELDADGYPIVLAGRKVQQLDLPSGAYIANEHDIYSRLTSTKLKNSGGTVLNEHSYSYNDGHQRTRQTRVDGSFVDYAYDDIGQLTSALGKESGGSTNRWHERFFYSYDAAGNLSNRVQNVQTNVFNVDILNQLTSAVRTNTSATVAGTTTIDPTSVTVAANGGAASAAIRYADRTFARTNVSLVNGANTFTAVATDSLGRGDTNTVSVTLPTAVTFLYDQNGNLRTNGTRILEYDDENQLTRITEPSMWKSEFAYDGRMRMRISRDYSWRNGGWVLTNEVRRICDSSLVMEERNQFNMPIVTYVRGKDLSGSMTGAGGVAGLLGISKRKAGVFEHHCFYGDANGNLTTLIDTNQVVVARYIYSPFGELLSATGLQAGLNKYRFGSKEWHELSGMVSFGYRWYLPEIQRWINRDPIGEGSGQRQQAMRLTNPHFLRGKGIVSGNNIYSFVVNSPISFIDRMGLDIWVGNRFGGFHQNINVGDPNGLYGSYSFQYPGDFSLFTLDPQGIVYFDDPPTSTDYLHYLETTPEQDKEARDLLADMLGEQWDYSLCNSTCQDFSSDMFQYFEEQFPNAYRPFRPPDPIPCDSRGWGAAGAW